MREAEQERQWKQLQAIRAREQQLGIPPDPQRMQGNHDRFSKVLIDLILPLYFVSDPNVQLQISTSLNDGSMSPIASPSPNSRNQFIAPTNKGRIMINPQSPSSNFQHPGRPVSVQLQQQQQRQQQRLNQSPFSPQGQTSQSPHDLYPGSPSTPGDSFARPSSEDQFLHSPQGGRSIGQPSPGHTPGPNRSPAYGQINQPQQSVRPLDNVYVQSPGTPRPSFSTGTPRTTVYARPDMFNNPPFGSPRSDTFANPSQQQQQQQQSPQEQNNRQLRDLLQRQQAPANIMPSSPFMDTENPNSSILSPKQPNMPVQLVQQQQQQQQQNPLLNSPNILQGQQQQSQNNQMQVQNIQMGQQINQQQQQQQSPSQVSQIQGDNTFRQPLPPGMSRQPRLQLGVNSMVGGNVMIRQSLGPQIPNQRGILISPDNRTRLSIRPGVGGGIINPQQQQMLNVQQQQQNQLGMQNQRMPLNQNYGNIQNDMMQHSGQQQQQQQQLQQQPGMGSNQNDQNMSLLQQRMTGQNIVIQQSIPGGQMTNQRTGNVTDENIQGSQSQLNQNVGDAEGIPDSVTAELEKLEQDENAVMGEVDILGGLGDDDDDLLDSLTAEMGADFNILEYADPELDTTDDEKTNLLDSLELDESEITKEEKLKVAELEKNKAQFNAGGNRTIAGDINSQQHQVNGQQQQQQQQQQILLNRPLSMQSNVIQNQLGNQMQPIIQSDQTLQQNAGSIQQQNILSVNGGHQQQVPHIQNQQILLNQQQMTQQGGNFQRQQVRIKAPEIQQIHQQMMLQLQQAAANGKPMQIGTRLVANNNVTGIVVGPNNIQLMFP